MKKSARAGKKSNRSHNIYRIALILLFTVAVAVAGGANLKFWDSDAQKDIKTEITLNAIQDIFPKARSINKLSEEEAIVLDEFENEIGYAFSSNKYAAHVKGFAGQVPLLVGYSQDSVIQGMVMLENHESEEYLDYIIEDNFLDSWLGLSFEEAATLEVDALSSATATCDGIIKTVEVSMYELSGMEVENRGISTPEIVQLVLTSLTIILGLLVCFNKSFKQYRTQFLLLVVAVMGFSYQKMISVSMLHGWIVNGFPWLTNIPLVVLVILSFVLPYTTKKQFYCHYMCPFGALQELAGKVSPLKKKKSLNWLKIGGMELQTIYTFLIIAGVIVGVYPELSFLEPFPSFSYEVVSYWMIGFGILFILLSMVYSKPWCKVCPTGFLIDSCKKSTKRNDKKYFVK